MKDLKDTRRLELPALPEPVTLDPSSTALIVVDMQNAYAASGGYLDIAGFDLSGIDAVNANVATLAQMCRDRGVQVVFLQNGWDASYVEAGGPASVNVAKSNALRVMRERPELQGTLLAKGGWDYQLIDALTVQEGDLLLPKPRYSGFVSTPLDSMLRSRGICTLLVCGVASNVCVETTIRDAFGLEYHPVMVEDCCLQAGPRAMHDATVFNVRTFFGWTTTLAEVDATLPAPEQ
ncbi:peroxyureidoacrylate/ureidoacrylate amidohydrolase RutB [Salipiger pallidus]|uniref:Peroxyureidoacrylate/ureidoacrylate amidohydrolase RutB n=1 Tax=Salipiger pallidus TaxID=1775170 RepID=A0A8J2ZHP2_9RHOB|nr:isochorismatase family protein [Salipiger pallidus]GGG65608.1 peroxyureidoacrylate/ureidoacrylate amidohydrolase RutB [Salipiger pallidus]